VVFYATLNDALTGSYNFTLVDSLDHPIANTEDNLNLTFAFTAKDSDGDTAPGTFTVVVNDDSPVAISPQHAFLPDIAIATVTVGLDADSEIDNNIGADQPGTLTFVNITNGEDTGFTAGGDPILLFVTGNGTVLEGRAGSSSGPLVFTVTLNHNLDGPDTYTVSMIGGVDNGSGVIFTDLSGGKAGNQPFKIITEPSDPNLQLLFTPINASSVSSDSDDAGIAPSQFIDPGQGLRIDFGQFRSGSNGFEIANHSPVNGFQFTIEQVANGNHADVLLRAVAADTDSDFTNDATIAIEEIQIYDSSGALVVPGGTIAVVFNPDGTVLITGLPAGYSVLTKTDDDYDRIEITGASPGDGKFSVGGLSVEQTQEGDNVDMTFDVALTDADGDSVVSQIDITLTPNSVAPAGVVGEPINLALVVISDPTTSTTPDGTVTSVVETTTLTATETAGSQTNVASATIEDGTMTAPSTAVLDPDGSETTSVTISGNGAVADTTTVSESGSPMVKLGSALEFTSLSHRVAGNLTDRATVEVSNPPELGRTALSRDRGAVTALEGQIAIASVMLVLEFLTENFKLASDANAGTLIVDPTGSSDAEVAAVSETRAVKVADTADTQATPVAADEAAVAALDAAITPDGGMPDLTSSSLPTDFALTESEGHEAPVHNDTIALAYSEFTHHGSGKDLTTPHDAAANSAESRAAAQPAVALNSHTTNLEAGSDGSGKTATGVSSIDSSNILSIDGKGGDAAHVHSAVPEHSATINSAGPPLAHDEFSFRGELPGHANDQPHFENVNPGNNGLGHQPNELPSQASAHAVQDLPAVTGVDDTKGGRPDHSHGAAAKDSSTVDTPATTIADNDAPGVRGEPPGHMNDKAQSGNADPGNTGLGHQPNELPSQASAHAVQDLPALTGVYDTEGARADHSHGAAAKDSSTIDAAGSAVAHTDSSGSLGAAPGDDQFHFAYANPGTSQSTELPSQAASDPAAEIPASTTDNSGVGHGNDFNAAALPDAVEDAKGGDKAQIRGAAAKDSSTADVAGATVADNHSSNSQGAASGIMNDQFNFANANPGNKGGQQSLELATQAASPPAVDVPAATTELAQIIDHVLTEATQAHLDPGTTPDQNPQLLWTNVDQHKSDFITHA
jgi:hypothetical protein